MGSASYMGVAQKRYLSIQGQSSQNGEKGKIAERCEEEIQGYQRL